MVAPTYFPVYHNGSLPVALAGVSYNNVLFKSTVILQLSELFS